jgi:hypothetical protein
MVAIKPSFLQNGLPFQNVEMAVYLVQNGG